ncbi:MAG: alpha/beta hydrolase domain-containing protein [Verrucomicrobiales bacterium]
MNRALPFLRFGLLLLGFFFIGTGPVLAEVARMEIKERKPFAEGRSFGRTGAYEIVHGRLFFEVDPKEPANARITDLDRAPTTAEGRVEFRADFSLLKPVDPEKGNGSLLYDVHNRGNKLALWTFNEGVRTNEPEAAEHAGNGFLLREGYSLLWTGWSGEVRADGTGRLLGELPVALRENGEAITGRTHVEMTVDEPAFSREFFWSPWGTSEASPAASLDNSDAELTARPHRGAPAEEIPREAWSFAREEDGKAIPDPASVFVNEGFRPGWIYDLVFTASAPRVAGLGLAGLRDAISFLRFEEAAADGSENPLAGAIDRTVIFGVSQSGRFIHHFLHEGLNLDPAGRRVFDGALVHVAGAGKGLFNYRFGMATVYGTHRLGNLAPADFFPFATVPQTDPVTGRSGDSLARLRENGGLPKIFFVQTSTEYWSRAASLLHTDVEGKRDLEVDPNVRIYLLAGTQHLGGSDDPSAKGVCRYPLNPVKHRGPVLRALLAALDQWTVDETAEPPASRYPRIDDGTLVDLDTFREQFPAIPDAETPQAVYVETPQAVYQPLRLDPGPRWHTEGIADQVPPETGEPYRTLVPAVDEDGNEVAGIRLPEIAVPLGTATGWNLRADEYGAGGLLADLHGGWFPFAETAAERESAGDPRPSLAERYPERADYIARVAETLLELRQDGYLLDEDVTRLLEKAAATELPR